MRVLITRATDAADETATRLRSQGHEPLVAPISEVRLREGADISLNGVQAVLLTSANGAQAFARRTKARAIKIFAVGDRTAAVAHALGFENVVSAQGDGGDLAALVRGMLSADGGDLFHPVGANADEGLARALADFPVRREIVYDVIYAAELPDAITGALRRNALDSALFYSPGGAAAFAGLVVKAELGAACAGMEAVCISRATAEALKPLPFKAVRIAASPDQDSLLRLLG